MEKVSAKLTDEVSLGPQAGVNHKKTNKCNIYEGGRLKKEGFEGDSKKSLIQAKSGG